MAESENVWLHSQCHLLQSDRNCWLPTRPIISPSLLLLYAHILQMSVLLIYCFLPLNKGVLSYRHGKYSSIIWYTYRPKTRFLTQPHTIS